MAMIFSRAITMAPLENFWELVDTCDCKYSDDCFSVQSLLDDPFSFDWSSDCSSSRSFLPAAEKILPDDIFSVQSLPDDPFSFDWLSDWSSSQSFLPAAEVIALPEDPFSFDFHCEIDRDGVENNREKKLVREVSGISGNIVDDRRNQVVEDDEDGGGCDLDDELVPKYVSRKLGRERMRKLGKRRFSKMNNSKRFPLSHVKPGCIHGKHGLGMKFI